MGAVAVVDNLIKCIENKRENSIWLDKEYGLVLGSYPIPHFVFSFEKESLVRLDAPYKQTASPATVKSKKIVQLVSMGRRGTPHEIETTEAIYKINSATQALIEGLNLIEDMCPRTIQKLSERKKRSKRPVAAQPQDLYDLPSQAKYSAKLKCGYFVGTNNKGPEAIGILVEACEIAGLKWGDDFVARERA